MMESANRQTRGSCRAMPWAAVWQFNPPQITTEGYKLSVFFATPGRIAPLNAMAASDLELADGGVHFLCQGFEARGGKGGLFCCGAVHFYHL